MSCDECGSQIDNTLHRLEIGRGVTAAQWMWAPAGGEPGHVLVGDGYVTVHPGPRQAGALVRARPSALPLAGRCVPALVVGPIAPGLSDLDGLFAEFRRVLRPHGLLCVLVPDGPPLGLRARGLRGRVRAHWTHRSVVEHPDWLLTAADFAVMGDDRVVFRSAPRPPDARAHVDQLCTAGLLPRTLPDDLRAELAANRHVREGRVSLRRLVARR
ncbi:hypothetical protein [Pseudonocardia endophytica]|uniref:Uncharacterized protein n=1 Tax=Pseudonocardia endophytica TaxID=401976 RepID=A0A4R1HXH8_PSEEN|nr:hypothetical protein [Pseudonocardia endophytica]TCK25530.1 hypothetical protein EV378_1342 [Pseudonocardia endophytica]